MRWMQVVEGTTFLLLAAWWAVSAALFYITENNVSGAMIQAASGNSSVPAPNLPQDSMAVYGLNISVGLHFALLGNTVCCTV